MGVAIPFKADFTKPLDVLFQCHQRIAANLEAIRRAAEGLKDPDVDAKAAFATIDTVLIHLRTAGRKHTQDEEESIFPRIKGYREAVVSEIFEVVDGLELQHKGAASIESALEKSFVSMSSDSSLDSNKIELFGDLSESLYDLYRPHIQIENEFVFPNAGLLLSKEELHAAGREMYQRRQTSILSPSA